MRVLYGVQGTGNGHLTRAIVMSETIKTSFSECEVDVLISGRVKEKLPIKARKIIWREGTTFVIKNGEVQLIKTLLNFSPKQLIKDIRRLKIREYDLLVTDYEPIVAWAGRVRRKEVIGIGHQYAFYYDIPIQGWNPLSKNIMKVFAPVAKKVGLHWHHFNQPILPPIVDVDQVSERNIQNNKVIVYLPFEETDKLINDLGKISDHEFYVYHPKFENSNEGNIHKRKISRTTFKDDLITSKAVICNTGFELISECLTLGTRIFTKPLGNQMEQQSNGVALSKLDYATVVNKLLITDIRNWLKRDDSIKISYPSTQDSLVKWLAEGATRPIEELANDLWSRVTVYR